MNTINDLRAQLFKTLTSLQHETAPMDIDRARAIADVAQVIINSAKVEVEHLKIAGGKGSGFINSSATETPTGVVGVTRHHLGG